MIRELWFKGALDLGMKPYKIEEEGAICLVKLVGFIDWSTFHDGASFGRVVTYHVWDGDRHLYAGEDVREAPRIYKDKVQKEGKDERLGSLQ